MADIFVSYSRQNETFGRILHTRLTGIKRDVWMDWEDIPFNSDWWEEIKRGIETSDNFLIILTQDFVSSPVCMLEVDYARQNNKRILIIAHNFKENSINSDLLLERTEQSDTIKRLLHERDIITISQENWRSIGHVNWLFFNDEQTFEKDFRNLIDTLDTDLEHVRTHTTLQVRALDWFENDRNWSFLLTGVQIDQAEEWLEAAIGETKSPQPTMLHSEFIKASRRQHDEQEQSILEMQTRAKRFRQASIIAGVIAAVMVIAGIGLTFWAGNQAQAANQKVSEANAQLADAELQIDDANTLVADADIQIAGANAQAESAGETLTSIPPTFEAIQVEIDANNTQVAAVGETLTPIGATLESAETAREEAQLLAEDAQTQVIVADEALNSANATLTPVAVTLTQSANEQERANALVGTVNADSLTAQAQLTNANVQIEVANTNVANADNLVTEANVALNEANATLSPIAPTLTQASNQISDANDTSTQSAAELATAAVQIAEANISIMSANSELTQIVPTLTLAGDLVIAANTRIAEAETQVAEVDDQIAAAHIENENLQETAVAIQQEAEFNRIEAQSQSLVVNAEQAAVNGDIDLALALILESYAINPDLPQTRRLLNNIAYTSARFILPDATFVTFSSDSQMVAYGDGEDVVVLDIASREEVVRLQGHSDTVIAGDFNFEDNLLVSGSLDTDVIVWNTATWEIERRLSDFDVAISDVRFDNQGNRIGAVGAKSELIVWNVNNGYAPVSIPFNNPETVLTRLYFYGDGSRVLAQGNEGQNAVQYRVNLSTTQFGRDTDDIYTTINPAYDVNAGHNPRKAMIETETFLTIYDIVSQIELPFATGFNWIQGEDSAGVRAFDSTGSNIIVALSNQREGTNNLVLLSDGSRERSSGLEFEGEPARRVTALAFSPDGRTILSGFGRYLVLWDVQTGRELRRFGTHLDDIVEINYSLDSNNAITRSRDGNYRVWDVSFSDPAVIGQVSIASSLADSATNPGLSPDGTEIYFNRASEIFRVDLKSGNLNQTAFSYFGLQDIVYSRTNTYLVTTSADTPTSNSVAMMWDGSLPSNEAQIWNNDIGGSEGETIDPVGVYSADGRQLALSMSRFVRVYDLDVLFNPEMTVRFDRSGMEIGAMIFSPDGRYLYAAANQLEGETPYALVRWDIREEFPPEIIPIPHIRSITSMDISDDGTQIMTSSDDQTVVLFDLESRTILRRMVGHQAAVNAIYFGQDDRVALSASDDGSLILWDLDTGQSIRRYVTGNPISGLYLSNDNNIAVSTEGTNYVTIWQIETLDDVIAWVQENRAILPLTAEQCQQFEVDCDA